MAIIVDPDNLDRRQVIFGTVPQKLSLRDVGDAIPTDGYDVSDGYAVPGTRTFISNLSTFIADGVAPDDILAIYNGPDAAHYIIESISSETQLVVAVDGTDFTNFVGNIPAIDGYVVFDVREPTGGSIVDGVTEQAIYSFAKEEWRTDLRVAVLDDDLIRHPFLLEAITREQMEIGGGTTHEEWRYYNHFTRKKVRTGGWADVNTAGVIQKEYSGIITLGDLDADTRGYYQIGDISATPIDFEFTGPVNEAILTFTFGGDDNRDFLKLFARKKYRTYAGSSITDIGVTLLETIVNRFPLSHVPDPAIVATDGQILGSSPFRNQNTKESGSDGSKTINLRLFTSASSTFTTNGVVAGDTLNITSGTEQGFYTIQSVDSETQLTIAIDADFIDWDATESSLAFTVTSTYIIRNRTDGVTADVDGNTGTLSSATGGFTGVVAPGDMVIIKEAAHALRGVYKVITVDSATQLTLNTSDKTFTSSSSIDFDVVEPGMYLQFKEETVINNPTTGNLTFADNGGSADTITRASGSWVSDGVMVGDVVDVLGSVSNDGRYTVASVAALVLTLVFTSGANAADVLVNETVVGGLGTGLTIFRNFKRTINTVVYAFAWRLFGRDTTLANNFQFIQHQLRQITDIDHGPGTARGDVTDLLMAFAAPTGTTFNLYIDDLTATDINNVTFTDSTDNGRQEAFVAAGVISFNTNLQNDTNAEYTMFFTNDDAGDDMGQDYGTPDAIVVQDADDEPITGNVGGQPSVSFTYDYDGNIQRGAASAGVDAPVTLVAIGLETAQFVLTTGTIARSKSNNFSLVSTLERNYSNP